jgi:hypothetical protein
MTITRTCLCNDCPYCDDFFEEEEIDDYDEEQEWQREQERRMECHCGAYQYSKAKGEWVQVADCVC